MDIHANKVVENQIRTLGLRLNACYLLLVIFFLVQIAGYIKVTAETRDTREDSTRVLKARGLIIVDEKGRERILIGSPIPLTSGRVRDDLKKVRELWSIGFPNPEQYMKWYQDYNHKANGIVILDENGFDRVALGDVPDPNIGKRIGPENGLIINDEKGFERGGFGLLRVGETNRMSLGLDSNRGTEAISLTAIDSGGTGISIFDASRGQTTFLGHAPSKHTFTNLNEPFSGLLMRDEKTARYKVNFLTRK